jgi:hypothetical protein
MTLRKIRGVLRRPARNHSLSLPHHAKPVGSEVSQGIYLSIRPQHLGPVDKSMTTQSEVKAQIALRQITSPTNHFA